MLFDELNFNLLGIKNPHASIKITKDLIFKILDSKPPNKIPLGVAQWIKSVEDLKEFLAS